MDIKSDQELVDASLGGDTTAFDELMRRHQRTVFRVAFSLLRSREDALDVSQTVFLSAFRNLRSFRNESQLRTWLVRIAANEAISLARRAKARPAEPIDPLMEHLSSRGRQEDELIAREDAQRLRQGLEGLNERYRLAVVLRYFHAVPIAEIAEVLGCSQGVVKSILFRGVRTLRRAVTGEA